MSDSAVWDAFCTRLFDQNQFAIKLGLDNICRALSLHGHPERSSPAIVVGGTNGKGGTAARLAAILQAHGLRVGLYTSPHLIELRERFRVNGAPVSRKSVLNHGGAVLASFGQKESDPLLTFFEIATLMATLIFKEAAVDVAIYEVGLGGRLDAVNAIEPALTVLTAIDLDHTQYLGNTLAAVAREKGALLRAAVPAYVLYPHHREVESALSTMMSPAHAWVNSGTPQESSENLALAAAERYLGHNYSAEQARDGLRHVSWPGRFEYRVVDWKGQRCSFLLDAAHNPAGTQALAKHLQQNEVQVGAFICAAMADKDLAMFSAFSPPVFFPRLQTKRAASAEKLLEAWGAGVECASIEEAIDGAAALAGTKTIVVLGSIYLLGEFLDALGVSSDELRTWN